MSSTPSNTFYVPPFLGLEILLSASTTPCSLPNNNRCAIGKTGQDGVTWQVVPVQPSVFLRWIRRRIVGRRVKVPEQDVSIVPLVFIVAIAHRTGGH